MNKTNCGVYRISNTLNNKIYIGSSFNLKSRKYNHFYTLKNNKHRNKYLQNAYNKYGENNFTWEVLEYVTYNKNKEQLRKELVSLEQFYIDCFKDGDTGLYNLSLEASSLLGYKHSKKFSESISKRMRGNKYGLGRKMSEENKKKLIERNLGNKYGLGRKISEEHKKKLIERNLGNKYGLGRKMSEENKKKLRSFSNRPVINLTNGRIFSSIKEAQEFYSITHISCVCNGRRKTAGGFKWSFYKKD